MADAFPLHIGSKGPRVRDAQWLLAGHNKLKIKTLEGEPDGVYGRKTAAATKKAKHLLGYTDKATDGKFGSELRAYLTGEKKRPKAMADRARARQESEHKHDRYYPLGKRGDLIGYPGQGTHSFSEPPNNWESDNAVDISVPSGTPVIAYADGTIGPSFGPLDSSNPRFAGIRLHLEIAGNELYYAHLRSTVGRIGPGARVKAGDFLGLSGVANGVPHLHLGFENGDPVKLIEGLPLA